MAQRRVKDWQLGAPLGRSPSGIPLPSSLPSDTYVADEDTHEGWEEEKEEGKEEEELDEFKMGSGVTKEQWRSPSGLHIDIDNNTYVSSSPSAGHPTRTER